ncbi:MAG: GNAT family N-acetyltransferase [Clostridia bacterium]|nr:GNAT family N-acetyltransferase [Clostridia bacterium]
MSGMRPEIDVVGAAIVKEGKVLAFRRSYGIDSVIHKYEFVGGKVKEDETEPEALKRECMEELEAEIAVGDKLATVVHDYPEYTVNLSIYLCRMVSDFVMLEHEAYSWLDCRELNEEGWAPADADVLDALKKGVVKFRPAETDEDLDAVYDLASRVMHATFDGISAVGEVNYMLSTTLTRDAIRANERDKGYKYELIELNGEHAGFFAYCPGESFELEYKGSTYLSKLYLLPFATGRGIARKVFNSLPRPLILDVKKDNYTAIAVYEHCGFEKIAVYKKDIGGGYGKDGFVMELK